MKDSIYGDIPNSWTVVQLGNVCEVNPPLPSNIRLDLTDNVTFVPMSAIDEDVGEVVRPVVRPYKEVYRGYTPFIKGDVLFAKITPSMENGKAAIAANLENGVGFGSTEFHVLRPSPLVLSGWILALLRREDFRVVAKSRFVGTAGQQRVPSSFLETFPIPLPPLPEQQRIVAILRKADELRQLRRRAKQRARDLLPALFYTMFGDINPKRILSEGWTISPIAAYFSDTQYGLSSSLIDEANGNVGVLRMNNISIDGELDLSDLRYLASEDVDFERYDLEAGDILFNRTNSKELVGKTGLWQPLGDQKYTFASYLIRVRLKQGLLPEYLWAALNSPYGKAQMRRLSKQAVNMANINTDELGSIILVIPPKQVQEKFRNLYARLATHQIIQKNAEQPLDNLLHSLLARAFTGELTAAWREAHAEELRAAADERDRLLELARKPKEKPVGIELNTTALSKTLASFQAVARELTSKPAQPALPGFPKLANGLARAVLPAFTRMAEVLRPFIELELGAEEVNRQLRENLSTFTSHIQDQLLQTLEPLVEHYRAEQQTYFAELAKKLADLARLQLEIPFRREEIEERVFEVAGGHDGYVTLPALAGDWRLNQFSRQSIHEAVNMLAVRGRLRPTVLKLETGDPERPYTLLSAYAPVREADLVSAEEIEL